MIALHKHISPWIGFLSLGILTWIGTSAVGVDATPSADLASGFKGSVQPLLRTYCLGCHDTKKKKGDLDLERFGSIDLVRKEVRTWQGVVEMLENGEMPPKKSPRPTDEERRKLVRWVRAMLDAEARARAGDPGRVVVRRLSNAEYNRTIFDLTGVDLQPARTFPIDGAAGEGFTNVGDALVISPALLNKYLNAAKEIAGHAVLLPDGFRFSPSKTRRDWTDEAVEALRKFYGQYTGHGKLPFHPYVAAAVRHRDDLLAGKITVAAVAEREKLNAKYFQLLWAVLTDPRPSVPLNQIRALWREAKRNDPTAVVAAIAAWQTPLWRYVPIGSYRYNNLIRQLPNDPPIVDAYTVRVPVKPVPGQSDVVLYLSARELSPPTPDAKIVWRRPRFEGGNKPPLLLRDYADYGSQYELDYQAIFGDTAKYLDSVLEAAKDRRQTADSLAKKRGLDPSLLQRWIDVLGIQPPDAAETTAAGIRIPMVPLELMATKSPTVERKPAINGWKYKAGDLPLVASNASEQVEWVPGRVSPHKVVVHPTQSHFVAAVWTSPIEGKVQCTARAVHAHPGCGNGVAWWLEVRQGERAALLAEGTFNPGGQAEVPPKALQLRKGDQILLAVDPRDGDISCDLTEISLTVSEIGNQPRLWDLSRDVADTILEGNPHADKLGNKNVWSFVQGRITRKVLDSGAGAKFPSGSLLAQWRLAAKDPARRAELGKLAERVQTLLKGPRPADQKHPDRIDYDALVALDGPLLQGLDASRFTARPASESPKGYGLDKSRFGATDASLSAPANSIVELRLPAALFREREFIVEGRFDSNLNDRVAQFQVLTGKPVENAPLNPQVPCVATPGHVAAKQLLHGLDEFRRTFPPFICFSRVIPEDETVCLKLYHREDEPLCRLFLDDSSQQRLDRLWKELEFISQRDLVEHLQLPQFIGFVTQDQPKELLAYFESQREPFRKRAEAFQKELRDADPVHIARLREFAAKAYRRPLRKEEQEELSLLYTSLRKKEMSHEDAFRTALTRVLVSPSFLFRIESSSPGNEARPVSNWELATRLSYFLWASMPDAELREVAAAGRLQEPAVLLAQTARMLKDPRARGLAVEFAAQWLHVRDIQQNREKNEKLFPTFDDKLRDAIFEETVLFFQDLFQGDRPINDILDADYTFLNETLAKHYGIPGVAGPEWRRVTGIKKYGRGGMLAQASVLTKQSGASRTSPILRGNWLVEVMLGEKLPKPPANVPILPDEAPHGKETVRQMVERHVRVAECSVCHQRIDPFGFALEKYDPIGRFFDKDTGGLPIDTKVQLRDGTKFDGIDGLRGYLLTQRKADFQRHFCQKLLGYALGRSVTLSDQPLLDAMVESLKKNDFRLSEAVKTIVLSQQFRYHRGLDATKEE